MIEAKNLHKMLGGHKVLNGVSFKVETGEMLALIGKSGVGKSVTLKHVVGLMKPDAGQVFVDGENITTATGRALENLRSKFGYLFQGGALFDSLTVLDNVAFPLKEKKKLTHSEIRERVLFELNQVGLAGMENKFPAELSGGMRKRASLARCLVSDPEIMLFDEPTTGLDPLTANTINDLILSTFERVRFTGIVVSHEIPGIFSLVHKVAMLYEGNIITYGTPEEIMEVDNPIVKRFIEAGIEQGHRKRGVREL